MIGAIILLVLLTGGCISIDTELQVPDQTVKPTLTGEDCVSIVLGIGVGTVRMSEAMKHGKQYGEQETPYGPERITTAEAPIRRIHSVMLRDDAGFGFGSRCIQIKGEP